jgi:Fur family transcriptional regulator, ferric uptake regulator
MLRAHYHPERHLGTCPHTDRMNTDPKDRRPMERATRQRAAIRDALVAARRPLLPQEILDAAQTRVPGLGIATVYRNLKQLVDDGVLKSVALPGENLRYEPVGDEHHHHFQCTACDRVFDVHACPGNLARLAPPGFLVEGHELTLYGRCSECRPA